MNQRTEAYIRLPRGHHSKRGVTAALQWSSLDKFERLARAVDFLARNVPAGILALTGKSPRPSDEDIHAALSAGRGHTLEGGASRSSRLGNPVEAEAERFLSFAADLSLVTWPELVSAVKGVRADEYTVHDWAVYELYLYYQGLPQTKLNTRFRAIVAERFQINVKTTTRIVKRVPLMVARAALMGTFAPKEEESPAALNALCSSENA